MSRKFAFNPSEATAGFPIFEAGSEEFVSGEPVVFHNPEAKKGENFGVRIMAKTTDGKKKFPVVCYMHSQGGRDYSKSIQMALMGYRKDQEAEYDQVVSGMDFGFDLDDKTFGDGWNELKNKHFFVDFNPPTLDDNQNKQNNVQGYRPA